MSSSPPPPTQKDLDCAFLARDSLFPLKIQRDGSHPTQFPAAEAAARVRDAAMEQHPERAASSFFPRRIVVVHDINNPTELQWNGQPDISNNKASFEVIPKLLSVSCRICGDKGGKGAAPAYVQKKADGEREIVLCSDKLLKRDYTPSKIPDQTPQSLVAVETALAHHVTKVGLEVAKERTISKGSTSNTTTADFTCPDLAAMEVLAARAAECYYNQTKGEWGQNASQVKRGPNLGHAGFSWYPEMVRNMLQNRCVRAVATRATAQTFKGREARKCVADAMAKGW
uniref:Uncharacterized protein n=1 Tax=Amphora coffeiformis TaxID=265554 RepID=A0A7S3KXK6_9STRA|mmetsp:Transcript_19362/g.36559  ORF Transcript_19362/g.36559 Transcript_19362/m.36559 type:complete len:285 (-) Transcript_19362:39-893(-)|eukprot:scaffold5215_cov181-Amphora_coffeaeformis.AAC.17